MQVSYPETCLFILCGLPQVRAEWGASQSQTGFESRFEFSTLSLSLTQM